MSLEQLKTCSLHGVGHGHAIPPRHRAHDHNDRDGQEEKEWSHAGLNRGPYGYWPYALTS